jgi:hypothetical protein
MVIGTIQGDVIVINPQASQSKRVVASWSSSHPESYLGLCWLKSSRTKFISGSDSGQIRLMDVKQMRDQQGPVHTFPSFFQLTSVSLNCLDEKFIASGYSRHVSLYDMCTGQRISMFQNLHSHEHINVVKFSNLNPNIFVSSSFDCRIRVWDLRQKMDETSFISEHKSKSGFIMACFSEDDRYLLASAVDNEVLQYHTHTNTLHFRYPISQKNSHYNYTRSYYMRGTGASLYAIIGSCDENSVHIHNAETGAFVRDVELTLPNPNFNPQGSAYCQSLRGDPFLPLNFSVLVNSNNVAFGNRIVHFDLLRRVNQNDDISFDEESEDDNV